MKTEKNYNQSTTDTFDPPIPFVSADTQSTLNNQKVDEVVKETVILINQGLRANKKCWQSILRGALRLNWLRLQHYAKGKRNDLVSNENKSGFNLVLIQLNKSSATVYRWIERVKDILTEIGVSDLNFPSPGTSEWVRIEKFIKGRAELIALLELPVGAIATPNDEAIIARLRMAAEAGDEMARQLISELEAGDTTIIQATQRYAMPKKISKKKSPSMLKLDPKTLQPKGQIINALQILEVGLRDWDQFPSEARIQAAQRIREVLSQLPDECKFRSF